MTKSILKLSLLSLLALSITGLPGRVHAQDNQNPAVEKKETKEKKPGAVPFHGKLKAVDNTVKTIAVGKLTIQITSETKITKAGKPAVLEDGIVGEEVGGAYQKTEDGKLDATSVRFGPKPAKGPSKEDATKSEK